MSMLCPSPQTFEGVRLQGDRRSRRSSTQVKPVSEALADFLVAPQLFLVDHAVCAPRSSMRVVVMRSRRCCSRPLPPASSPASREPAPVKESRRCWLGEPTANAMHAQQHRRCTRWELSCSSCRPDRRLHARAAEGRELKRKHFDCRKEFFEGMLYGRHQLTYANIVHFSAQTII
jgi:hypothetical protein